MSTNQIVILPELGVRVIKNNKATLIGWGVLKPGHWLINDPRSFQMGLHAGKYFAGGMLANDS